MKNNIILKGLLTLSLMLASVCIRAQKTAIAMQTARSCVGRMKPTAFSTTSS